MAESKTARQSMMAGMIRDGKKDPFDTPEKKIAELRKQRTDKLFVNRMDFVDALLEKYDALLEAYDVAIRQNQTDVLTMKPMNEARDEAIAERDALLTPSGSEETRGEL